MKFGWKVLIPTSLVWILILATLRVMSQRAVAKPIVLGFSLGVVLLVVMVSALYDRSTSKAKAAARLPELPEPSFPIPALPGQQVVNQIVKQIDLDTTDKDAEIHNG
jgi:NADH-quinone oxidoreductase subunit H